MSSQRRWPQLRTLHKRHRGLTPEVCASYHQAMQVVLSRHHKPPTLFAIERDGKEQARQLDWEAPGERAHAAWKNQDDATRDAAYLVGIAAVEIETGMRAVERADTRTGADYYVSKPRAKNGLEGAYRLEVSGTDHGTEAQVRERVLGKLEQLRRGDSNLPGLATVVGFKIQLVVIKALEDEGHEP